MKKESNQSNETVSHDLTYLQYAANCVDIVENIRDKYQNNGTIYPDEIKAIFKKYGLRL